MLLRNNNNRTPNIYALDVKNDGFNLVAMIIK
jgi:hypothetical protein